MKHSIYIILQGKVLIYTMLTIVAVIVLIPFII